MEHEVWRFWMTKLDAGLITPLPASDSGSAAVWGSKRINPRPQSCLCLTWSGCSLNDDPRLLHCLNQMLAVVLLSQHRVSSSKTVRPRAPCGARCIGHAVSTWSAVRLEAPHSQFDEGRDSICAWTNGIAQHQSAGG